MNLFEHGLDEQPRSHRPLAGRLRPTSNARFFGSTGAIRLNPPVVTMAPAGGQGRGVRSLRDPAAPVVASPFSVTFGSFLWEDEDVMKRIDLDARLPR